MFPFHMALTRKHMRIKTWIKPIWYVIANSFDINVPYTFDNLSLPRITCFYFLSSSAFYMTHCFVLKRSSIVWFFGSSFPNFLLLLEFRKWDSHKYESQWTKSDNTQRNTTWLIFWRRQCVVRPLQLNASILMIFIGES